MRDELIRTIADGLELLAYRLRGRSAARLFDLHIGSENFVRDFLNCLRILNLENLNVGKKPFPAIDLGDSRRRESFQVTTDGSKRKIQESLTTFETHGLEAEYDRIQFLILKTKQKTYGKFSVHSVKFDPANDIIDINDLIREVTACTVPTLRELEKLIQNEGLIEQKQTDDSSMQAVREFVVIDPDSVVGQKQLVFTNTGAKTVRNIYLGSYLITEDGTNHIVLYDEVHRAIPGQKEVRQGDILNGEGRYNYLQDDIDNYGQTLNDRIIEFMRRCPGSVRLFCVVRAVGDSIHNSLLSFWSSSHFDRIESAQWHHVHEDGSRLYKLALKIADIGYSGRVAAP